MPNAFGNIDCRTLLDRHAYVAQHAKAAAFQNEQHLVCSLMLMGKDTGTAGTCCVPRAMLVEPLPGPP